MLSQESTSCASYFTVVIPGMGGAVLVHGEGPPHQPEYPIKVNR